MRSASAAIDNSFWRVFFCLWGFAIGLDVLGFWLAGPPNAMLVRELWIPLHTQSRALISLAAVVQNSVRMAVIVGAGLVPARKLGLGAPLLEAWFRQEAIRSRVVACALPIALTVFLYAGCMLLSDSPLFHPNRQHDAAVAAQFADSPMAAEAVKEVEKLGFVGGKEITAISMTISDLARAADLEIGRRLFGVSIIALFLLQVFGNSKVNMGNRFIWTAVFIVALVATVETVAINRENTLLIESIFQGFGLPHGIEPLWLVGLRTGIQIVPSAIALGFIYVRHGIESSIAANFCAATAYHVVLMFGLTHLR